jgi:tetratricopeptide (TPR) repeat protein
MKNPAYIFLGALLALTAGCSATTPRIAEPSPALQEGRELLYGAANRFEYPRAIELLAQAVGEAPENSPARLDLAYAYLKRGRYTDAEAQLNAVPADGRGLRAKQQLWASALRLKVQDRVAEEAEAWARITQADPNDRWAWYEQASALASLRQFEAASAAAAAAVAAEPDPKRWESSWLYYLHSKALYRNGDYAQAARAAARGKGNATTWRSTYFRQAMAEIKTGAIADPETAVAEYLRISNAEGRNTNATTYANIALFYFELGDFDAAVRYARQAVAEDDGAYPQWTLAFSLAEAGQEKAGEKVAAAALENHPTNRYLLAAQGWARYRNGQCAASVEDLQAAKDVGPRRNHHLEALLGHALRCSNDPGTPAAPPVLFIE